jgi:hypothetical protein
VSDVLFPNLHGLAWSVKRTPTCMNVKQPGSSPGRETRVGFGPDPVDKFELEYVVLHEDGKWEALSRLDAFFRSRQGSLKSFLLDASKITKNPKASAVTNQPLVIDFNYCAPLVHTIASGFPEAYDEAIYELAINGGGSPVPPVIKHNGVTLTEGVTGDYIFYDFAQVDTGVLNANGINYSGCVVKLITSPAINSGLTADFGWAYRVRFENDEQEFDMFWYLLWKCQQVQLVGTRT